MDEINRRFERFNDILMSGIAKTMGTVAMMGSATVIGETTHALYEGRVEVTNLFWASALALIGVVSMKMGTNMAGIDEHQPLDYGQQGSSPV